MTDDLESDNKLLEVSTPDFRAALNTELTLIVHFLLKQGRRILKRALQIFFLVDNMVGLDLGEHSFLKPLP